MLFRFLIISALLHVSVDAEAQFIRFSINLPPSFELTDKGDIPKILEAPKGTGGMSLTGVEGVRWIEIRTTENVDLIVEMRYDRRSVSGLAKTYFLNDGTMNFDEAMQLLSGQNQVQMLQKPTMISELKGKPKYISAWIGLAAGRSGVLTIIYP